MTNSELSNYIDEYCSNRRNRGIVKDRLIDGEKISFLSEKYDLSERQINNIVQSFRKLL